jgi:hypothetical protein
MWVVGAVAALVLLVGVVRAVRRPRRKLAVADGAVAADDVPGDEPADRS